MRVHVTPRASSLTCRSPITSLRGGRPGGRTCFLDQFKHGPPERRAQPGRTPAIDHSDHRGPSRPHEAPRGRAASRGDRPPPVIIRPGCLLLLPRKLPAINFHFHFRVSLYSRRGPRFGRSPSTDSEHRPAARRLLIRVVLGRKCLIKRRGRHSYITVKTVNV